MFTETAKKFFAILCISLILSHQGMAAFTESEAPPPEPLPLKRAIAAVAAQGFYDTETQYKAMLQALHILDRNRIEAPLTEAEKQKLIAFIKSMRSQIPRWSQNLVAQAKRLQEDAAVDFGPLLWDGIKQQCMEIGSAVGASAPMDDFIEYLEKGAVDDPDLMGRMQDVNRDLADCQSLLASVAAQIQKAKTALERELLSLESELKEKQLTCQELPTDAEQKACFDKLLSTRDKITKTKEAIEKLQSWQENHTNKALVFLGAMMAIVGAVIVCTGAGAEVGATLIASGLQIINKSKETTAHEKKVTEHVETDVRDLSGQSGPVTEKGQALIDTFKGEGFKKVSTAKDLIGDGDIPYVVMMSASELILVHIGPDPHVSVRVNNDNCTFAINVKNPVTSIGQLKDPVLMTHPYIKSTNQVKINLEVALPDGTKMRLSINEEAVGLDHFVLTVEEAG